MKFENICVIGLGYIGLPTAAMFASQGISVNGVDVSPEAVETINRGDIHIVEPGLKDLVRESVENKRLIARYEPEKADAFLIAVPTPFKKDNKDIPEPDLSFIRDACTAIAPVLEKGNLVVLESTSPVGATEMVSQWLSELRPDLAFPISEGCEADIFVAHCPERVLPGRVLHELVYNDRIIGGITQKCSEAAKLLYEMFVLGACHITNARTAEMAKLTENASRDVQIAFANELSLICDEKNINVWELISLANKHPRVNILQPGPGVGGHCIAVDPWFLISSSSNSKLMRAARDINDYKPSWVIEKILEAQTRCGLPVYLYGLTFKPNIDDLRESPSLQIAEYLNTIIPNHLSVVDPYLSQADVPDLSLIDMSGALKNKAVHVMLVDHDEFKCVLPKLGEIVDTRGCWA